MTVPCQGYQVTLLGDLLPALQVAKLRLWDILPEFLASFSKRKQMRPVSVNCEIADRCRERCVYAVLTVFNNRLILVYFSTHLPFLQSLLSQWITVPDFGLLKSEALMSALESFVSHLTLHPWASLIGCIFKSDPESNSFSIHLLLPPSALTQIYFHDSQLLSLLPPLSLCISTQQPEWIRTCCSPGKFSKDLSSHSEGNPKSSQGSNQPCIIYRPFLLLPVRLIPNSPPLLLTRTHHTGLLSLPGICWMLPPLTSQVPLPLSGMLLLDGCLVHSLSSLRALLKWLDPWSPPQVPTMNRPPPDTGLPLSLHCWLHSACHQSIFCVCICLPVYCRPPRRACALHWDTRLAPCWIPSAWHVTDTAVVEWINRRAIIVLFKTKPIFFSFIVSYWAVNFKTMKHLCMLLSLCIVLKWSYSSFEFFLPSSNIWRTEMLSFIRYWKLQNLVYFLLFGK